MRGQNDLITITTTYRRYIPQLSTVGPIVVPIKVPISRCTSMLAAGIPLFECDTRTGKTVELNINNIFNENLLAAAVAGTFPAAENKFNSTTPVAPQKTVVEPAKVEAPVMEVATESTETETETTADAQPRMTKAERKAAARAKAEAEAAQKAE